MLRANTAKFEGKILNFGCWILNQWRSSPSISIHYLEFIQHSSFKIYKGSLKWMQSLTWLFWLTNRNQLESLPSSTKPLFNKTLADALFSSSVNVWILDTFFWFRRIAIIALHASVAYPLPHCVGLRMYPNWSLPFSLITPKLPTNLW